MSPEPRPLHQGGLHSLFGLDPVGSDRWVVAPAVLHLHGDEASELIRDDPRVDGRFAKHRCLERGGDKTSLINTNTADKTKQREEGTGAVYQHGGS